MLKITDLTVSKELESGEMAAVRGGMDLSAIFDASTSITNNVADVDQIFNFAFVQANEGYLTNNQGIIGGNGTTSAPVIQEQIQGNYMDVSGLGNTFVG